MPNTRVEEAATHYVNTPWRHQGRTRRGIDCAGLVICTLRDIGHVDQSFNVTGYAPVTTLDRLMSGLDRVAYRKPGRSFGRGDIVALTSSNRIPHCGIVTAMNGRPAIIHSSREKGYVRCDRLFGSLRGSVYRVYEVV